MRVRVTTVAAVWILLAAALAGVHLLQAAPAVPARAVVVPPTADATNRCGAAGPRARPTPSSPAAWSPESGRPSS